MAKAKAKAKTKAKSKPKMKAKARPAKKRAMKKKAPARRAAAPKARAPKPRGVSPVPEGHHTVTPHLVVRGAAAAIDFYQRAFGATENYRMPGPNDAVMHAELRIGDSMLYLCDEFPGLEVRSPQSMGGTSATIHLYVPDVDAAFNKAVAAGAKVIMPVTDMFWGDRYGKVADPFGHSWSLATHKEDLTPEQLHARHAEAFSGMSGGDGQGAPAAEPSLF